MFNMPAAIFPIKQNLHQKAAKSGKQATGSCLWFELKKETNLYLSVHPDFHLMTDILD